MTQNAWMVRNEGGLLFDDFKQQKLVALGWEDLGELTAFKTIDDLKDAVRQTFPEFKPRAIPNIASLLYRFAYEMQKGDGVVTYDPQNRVYLVGEVMGDYWYNRKLLEGYPSVRLVKWLGEVKRDALSLTTRNSLGSVITLFALNEQVWGELKALVAEPNAAQQPAAPLEREDTADLEQIKDDQIDKAFELLKDKILALDDRQAEHLVAAILRAMGYKAKVTPVGPDRNLDVFASPDGLGFQEPVIKAEVKHRKSSIGAKEIRSFGATLKSSEKGLYVSTGGYSKDAKYEAANFAITLIALEDLARLVIEHYDQFDEEGRRLLPLVRIYWPAE